MKNVIIVGVGALGSHVALLARNWKVQLTLVDFDRIEQKNTQAQFHTRMGLRQNKAQALAKSLQGLYGLRVGVVPHKLTKDNVHALLGEADLVIDCTDNIAARQLIQDYALCRGVGGFHRQKGKLPCLHGCLSADGTFARVIWTEHFTPDPEGAEGEATCEDGEQLPFFALASAQVALVAQRFLADEVRASYQMGPGSIVRLA